MNELSMLVTITDRNTTKRFISLYESFGVNVTFSTVGSGTHSYQQVPVHTFFQ